jgi:hypothetical protein
MEELRLALILRICICFAGAIVAPTTSAAIVGAPPSATTSTHPHLGVVDVQPPKLDAPSSYANGTPRYNNNSQHPSSPVEPDHALDLLTLFLVLVGLAQAILFFWQLRLIKDSTDDAATAAGAAQVSADVASASLQKSIDTTKKELRAYIGISEGDRSVIVYTSGTFICLDVIVRFINYGRTPANNVYCAYKTELLHSDLPDSYDFNINLNESPTNLTLFPTQDGVLACRSRGFTAAEIAEIYSPTISVRRLFAYGYVEYHDGFEKRRTNFCYMIAWRLPDGMHSGEKPGFYYFKRHNDAN